MRCSSPPESGRRSRHCCQVTAADDRYAAWRSPDSLSWAGIHNTHFWIDPHRRTGVVLLMQVLPFYDEQGIQVLRGFEELAYRHELTAVSSPSRRHSYGSDMDKSMSLVLLSLLAASCAGSDSSPAQTPTAAGDTAAVKAELLERHGDRQRARIERGVDQVAALWRAEDGDLRAFALEHFIADPDELDATFARLEFNFEQLDGHLLALARELRRATDLDIGPLLRVDPLFTAYEPAAHVTDDLFHNKIAFIVLLNFPLATLAEKLEDGSSFSRRQWAEVRLTDRFTRRVPADVKQQVAAAAADADLYISEYNIWMHHLLDEQGQRLFPKGLRLISHWNLRDELKARYAEGEDGLARQRLITKVMERIVMQTIPQSVIDNPTVDWNPFTNEVTAAPAETVEEIVSRPAAPAAGAEREPDVRYAKLLAHLGAARRVDPYSPAAPTELARTFDENAEIPEERVKALLIAVLSSSVVPRVASEIQTRLGRPLEPHDLWFNGFVPRGTVSEEELNARTRARYPTADAFAADIPRLLTVLGFSRERARYLADHIMVDPSRGAGHALQAARRGDYPRLRTRVERDGMDYKGYNIAIHELGHNVEQVFSLYDVDHTLLGRVPNTAFTEALAFVFQARDLELLGYPRPGPESERLRVLNTFWQTWEIAGVALVDIAVWHWMYAHPDASPADLRDATLDIARDVWNQYYAPVLGGHESVLLGIYSHMISYPLYLFNYPLGHLIAFQVEEHLRQAGPLGQEFERMATYGAVTPDVWMEHATGAPVNADALLRATERALGERSR